MDWAAVEWADGELRLWLADGRRPVIAPCGEDPAAVLRGLVRPLLAPGQILDVFASGWPGTAPVRVPCPPPPPGPVVTIDPQIRLYPMPGLVQERPLDLIETPVPRIRGHLAATPDFDGVLCLPGHPSAWVQVSAAEIVSFRSFLTMEMLSALITPNAPGDDAAFAETVAQAMSRPAAIASELSSVRAGLALGRFDRLIAQARMAGLLIGAELAAARPWWLGQNVVIFGQGWLADCYAKALGGPGGDRGACGSDTSVDRRNAGGTSRSLTDTEPPALAHGSVAGPAGGNDDRQQGRSVLRRGDHRRGHGGACGGTRGATGRRAYAAD